MSLDPKLLDEQIAATETELENHKAAVYRCDGALQMLKHLRSLCEHVQDEVE